MGIELSHEAISNVTEAVMDEVTQWQNRSLEVFYPVIYFDALVVKVRDQNRVVNRHAHIAVGVDTEGVKKRASFSRHQQDGRCCRRTCAVSSTPKSRL